jgi:hypothetical protein
MPRQFGSLIDPWVGLPNWDSQKKPGSLCQHGQMSLKRGNLKASLANLLLKIAKPRYFGSFSFSPGDIQENTVNGLCPKYKTKTVIPIGWHDSPVSVSLGDKLLAEDNAAKLK